MTETQSLNPPDMVCYDLAFRLRQISSLATSETIPWYEPRLDSNLSCTSQVANQTVNNKRRTKEEVLATYPLAASEPTETGKLSP